MTSLSQHSPPLRVYVQNVCVLPTGMRERYLPPSTLASYVAVLVGIVFLGIWLDLSISGTLLLFLFSTVTGLAPALAMHLAAAVVGTVSKVFFRGHDYKYERLGELARRLLGPDGSPKYDIVILQELYATWYSDSNRRKFSDLMSRNGYKFSAMPSRASTLPAMWANSGLAIFSPYPIRNVLNKPFASQILYDKFCVNRGMTCCDVELPSRDKQDSANERSTQLLHVVSTHFGPSLAVLQFTAAFPKWLRQMLDVHSAQVQEVAQYANEKVKAGQRTLVAGDFNAIAGSPIFINMKRTLRNAGLRLLTGDILKGPGPKFTCNPEDEFLLTGGVRTSRILDYAFGSGLNTLHCSIEKQRMTKPAPFQYVSDHMGIDMQLEMNDI